MVVEKQREQFIHHWFESQSEQTPDAIAVIYQEQHLTYTELNRRANCLAHYFRN
jgi:non-ribosomal peptide synthetase component F